MIFTNWKARYQDLYNRHEKLAVTMTVNLSMAQEQIDNHVEQGKSLLLANEDLMNQVQQLSEKVESLEISLGLQEEYTDHVEKSSQMLVDEVLHTREEKDAQVQVLLAKIDQLECDLFMKEGYADIPGFDDHLMQNLEKMDSYLSDVMEEELV